MKEIILDTLIDALKLIPFLFVAFIIMEYIEHKLSKKTQKIVTTSGKFGPVLGSLLGAFPQCGFSVMATNLYAARIISLGTLIAIYLSTSDEMLPLLISNGTAISFILLVILIKVIIGIVAGVIIDLFRKKEHLEIQDMCEEDGCDCEHGILKSALHHTFNIGIFILITTFLLNTGLFLLGEDKIGMLLMKNTIFGPFLASIVGIIPNCAASVVITELYISGSITFGSLIAGLLTGSGVALLILFKVNKNIKENIKILSIIYLIGALSGIIIDLLKIF